MPVSLTKRLDKGSPLLATEVDENWQVIEDAINALESTTALAASKADAATAAVTNLTTQINGLAVAAPGFIQPFAGSVAPTGWLICDGAAVSRTTYAELFDAIGVAFGAGDGSTTFNIPDGRGRTLVGVSPGTLGTGRNAARVLGASGGEEDHTTTLLETPAHAHGLAGLKWDGVNHAAEKKMIGWPLNGESSAGSHGNWGDGEGGLGGDANPINTAAAGGNQAHNNMQPFFVANWLIKT